jgi:arsenate reductase
MAFNEAPLIFLARHIETATPVGANVSYMKATTTIYGIKNCDTMKKARAWLGEHGIAYQFHDYKEAGIDRERLESWMRRVGWEILLNRAGTTFRKLPDAAKVNLDERKALALMLAQPSMIKRPVLEHGKTLTVGFSPEKYSALK